MSRTVSMGEPGSSALSVVANNQKAADAINDASGQDMVSLWKSGLSASLLFSVSDPPSDQEAERRAQSIVARHLERQKHLATPAAMVHMVDFQRALQMRSKVISAIEMLMEG